MNRKKQQNRSERAWNETDYAIPKFSYRSAFLIFGLSLLLTILTVWLTDGNRTAIIVVLSASIALTTGISQYFIDTKRGMTKGFFMTTGILFLASVLILMFVPF
ncbi:MAG: hypothetical protein ACI32N_01670 [Bulleidia sp.]